MTHPAAWFLRTFGGSHAKGSLRLFDDDGLRLEVLWETPRGEADVPSSIQKFLAAMEKDAKKAKKPFGTFDHPNVLSKRRRERERATAFGWSGHSKDPLATQGFGASWQCATCRRVVVAHLVGRATEATRDTERLASEILASLCCHGTGGWETWSVFGMRLEVPEEFEMKNARLLAGRIEMEWERVGPQTPLTPAWTRFDERIALVRVSAASVILKNEALADWTARTLANPDKKRHWGLGEATRFGARDGWLFRGAPRELRKRALFSAQHRYARRKPPSPELRAWRDEPSNKIFALATELRPNNAHVWSDIVDSLQQEVSEGSADVAEREEEAATGED